MCYTILILGLLILAILSYRRIDLALGIVILTLPFYLIRLEILSIPTTFLELMIYVVFLVWIATKINKKLSLKCHCEKSSRTTKQSHSFFKITGLLRFIATSLAMTKKKISIPIFLILLGCIISIIVSPNKQAGFGILKGWFIDPLLLFFIISDVVKTKKETTKILSFLAISGIIVATIGLFYYFFNELTYDGRLKAFFLSPNHLAMYLAPAGIICFGLFLFFSCHSRENENPELKKNRFRIKCGMTNRYFYLLGFVICSTVIFLTYSYGAWMGFGVAILFLILFFQKKIVWRKKVLLLIIATLFLSAFFFFQHNTEKFQNFINFSRSSFESRIMIWKSSAAILKDRPFLGIGPGNFQDFYLDYQKKFPPYLEWAVPQPHNLFLAFYLQCGLLGLIGFLWLIFLFFKKGFQAIASKQQTANSKQLSIILIAIMLYILIHGLVDTPYWKNDLAIIFWIIIGLMQVIQNSNFQNKLFKNLRSGQ
jgi:putative inorganic carbon (HCO3(-)) transporter